MKKITLIILLVIVVLTHVKQTNAQVLDTVAYIKTIIANKNQYVGKPFSVLLKDLKINIKYFSPFAGIHYDISKETSTSFWFIKPSLSRMSDFSAPRLDISWNPYLNNDNAMSLWKRVDGDWTSESTGFYQGGIVSDIMLLGGE